MVQIEYTVLVLKAAINNSYPFMIVPAYNEALRIEIRHWSQILERTPQITWLFVDDGSEDGTASILQALDRYANFRLIKKRKNEGKAEAIRTGFLSIPIETNIVGFTDCDKAFDINELVMFLENGLARFKTIRPPYMLIASRVKLAGRNIERSTKRHLLGRVIATIIGFVWREIPYDTQAGLKLILLSDKDRKAIFPLPFKTKWLFDIEIMDRLGLVGTYKSSIEEIPLRYWRDISGSKITAREYPRILLDMGRLLLILRHRNSRNDNKPPKMGTSQNLDTR